MITHHNVSLVKFKDTPAAKALDGPEIHGLPVVLRVGAINYNLGMIHTVRKGRDEFFGKIILEIDGTLEFDDSGKPIRFVYLKEKSG